MALVPRGKARVMVAQQFSNPLSEGFGGTSIADQSLETENAMEEDVTEGVNDDVSMGAEQQEAPQEKSGRKTLTTYIFEKLQRYGYPGRRLQEFKSEFVKESVSPDGVKDIEVVIPDKKYQDEKGFTDTIENEELKEIAHEVHQMFGLNFNGADRAGGKWTIKFTSASIVNPEDEGMSRDSLDQVYGRPDKTKPEQQQQAQKPVVRSASTITEMIKEKKNQIIDKLKNIIGE